MKRWRIAALTLLSLGAGLGMVAGLHAQLTTDAWQPITPPPGGARQIAIGRSGAVAALDASGTVFRRDATSGAWQSAGTGMARIAIDAAGRFWAIDQRGVVQRQTPAAGTAGAANAEWRAAGEGAIALAAAPNGNIIVATNTGALAQYEPAKNSWSAVNGSGTRVAVDGRGLIWIVSADGNIARRLGDAWIGVPGSARDIAADALGNVVIAAPDGKVYEWSENEVRWNEVSAGALAAPQSGAPAASVAAAQPTSVAAVQATSVAAGAGQLWRADSDGKLYAKGVRYTGPALGIPVAELPVFRKPGLGGTPERNAVPDLSPLEFIKVASTTTLSGLAIGYDGSVYATASGGALQRWSNAQRRFNSFPGALTQVRVSEKGLPLGANGGNALLQHDGAAWRKLRLPYAVNSIANAGDAVILALAADGQLYRLDPKVGGGGAPGASRLAGNVEQVAVALDGSFWYRNNAGLLFRCNKTVQCERESLAVADLAIGPGGTVYAVDTQGNLQRYNRVSNSFDILRRSVVARVAVGPNDRPWIIEKNGDVWAARLFERDESGDLALARLTERTVDVTTPEPNNNSGNSAASFTFTEVDVPVSAPGFANLGSGLNDITVGLDDQIIVTGFDASANPCTARTAGWRGRNWIYSPAQRRFIHLDSFKRVQYQVAIAARNLSSGTAPPTLAGAPAVPAFYGITRACERYYLNEYDNATFTAQTAAFFDQGGLSLGQSLQRSSEVTANTRDTNTISDLDVTQDEWVVATFTQRMINFIGIGSKAGTSSPKRSDQKFARLGVGATRDVLWATTFDSDVYEYVKATDRFEKRNIFEADKAQDIGVGKDGSVFIVDLAGRLKKWDAAQKTFVFTGRSGVTRVAVTSKGKPVVANFPSSQRVSIAQ